MLREFAGEEIAEDAVDETFDDAQAEIGRLRATLGRVALALVEARQWIAAERPTELAKEILGAIDEAIDHAKKAGVP